MEAIQRKDLPCGSYDSRAILLTQLCNKYFEGITG